MTFRSHRLAVFAVAVAVIALGTCVRAQGKPPSPGELVARQRLILAGRMATIDARAMRAAEACAATEASLRAAVKARDAAPPDPSPARVHALQRESVLLARLEADRQRRVHAAVDRLLLHESTIDELDAAIAARRRLPRATRGPLARRDALLAAMLGWRAELERGRRAADRRADERRAEMEATRTEHVRVEALLQAAEQAWLAATERRDQDRETRRAALRKEKEALGEEGRRLERERLEIDARTRAARARLHRALSADTTPERTAPALPELAANVAARAGITAMVDAQRALARAAEDEARRLSETAAWHRATGRYLERCRDEGIRLPADPAFDPRHCLACAEESEREAARHRAEAVRRHEAVTRAEEPLAMHAEEALLLRARYLDRAREDALFPPAPPARIGRPPELPATASAALHRSGHTLAQAHEAASRHRLAIRDSRARGQELIAAALDAGDSAAREPTVGNSAAAFAASLDTVAAHTVTHRILLADQRRLDLKVEALRSEWIRGGGPIAGAAPPTWHEALQAWASHLPGNGLLAALTLALLMLGWCSARIRRPARLGETLRLTCGLAALVLAVIGLLRGGAAAHALTGAGALGAGLLLWAVPLDFLAGIRLRFDGRGREGELIQNGDLSGRVLRRGWLASTLVTDRGESTEVVRVGNRRLVRECPGARERRRTDAGAGLSADAAPGAPELTFHITLQSDWMAARQLVGMIGRRHDPRAGVRFHVEGRRIRLTLRFDPGTAANLDRVRLEVAQAIASAPFAQTAQ